LSNVKTRSQTTSIFLGRYIILTAIQLQLYQKSVEKIASLKSEVLEAEALMKSRKNSQENSNNSE
jgi:hypothetical protein